MPQLPSGRHIAIDPAPLVQLTKDRDTPQLVHQLMAISGLASLFDWLDLHFFVTKEEALDKAKALDLTESSLPAPEGLVGVATGYRLSDWQTLAAGWTDADRVAFAGWLESDRAKHQFDQWLQHIRKLQKQMLSDDAVPLTRLLATMYEQGVHPLQNDRTVGGKLWEPDVYDMLAALAGVVIHMINNPEPYADGWQAKARAEGMLQMLMSRFPFLRDSSETPENVQGVAIEWRSSKHVEALSALDQDWLSKQLPIECINLSAQLGGVLEDNFPQGYAVVHAVEMAAFFEQQANIAD
jgi:hypothetical protein